MSSGRAARYTPGSGGWAPPSVSTWEIKPALTNPLTRHRSEAQTAGTLKCKMHLKKNTAKQKGSVRT